MLSVIGKAFKRRKLASQLSQNVGSPTTASEDQPVQPTNLERSEVKASGSVVRADTLDTAQNTSPQFNDSNSDVTLGRDIVFIDGGIPQIGKLLRELDPHAEIHILDQQTDGTDQIVTHLAGREELQILHIFCHGDNGVLNLGSGKVTPNTITTIHSKAFSQIGASLSDGGKILIYGCDFCGGTTGRAAATQLAMLTGAEIAASPEIFTENEIKSDGTDRLANTPSASELSPKEETSSKSKVTELYYSVPDGGRLETSAEDGLLHSAGLAGGTLKSATDGSGASIKLYEPGVSGIRPHILPNGAELTQFTNGTFIYQSETDAGEGELITCLAVGSDHTLAKIVASVNVERLTESASAPASQREDVLETAAREAEVSNTDPLERDLQVVGISSPRFTTQLSISVPDTSAGPSVETTTMVDAPLIFLQRNRNAISVSGSNNDMIVLTLTATNGTLCARPLKGAQVDGFNSVTLTIAGSVSQINAALDGLRFVNSPNQVGPTELTVSAKYEKGSEETAVTKTIAIFVKSIALDGTSEDKVTEVTGIPSVETELSIEVPQAARDDQSDQVDATMAEPSEPQGFETDTSFIAEFVAPIGAVTTIANAGETMHLKEGDLQINRDGTFSFSLKEGYSKPSSRVTCSVSGQSADPVYPPKIVLNLSRLPLEPGKAFTGNVFSSDIYASKLSVEEYEAIKRQRLETQTEVAGKNADEIVTEVIGEGSEQPAILPEEEVKLETKAAVAVEEDVTFPEILENQEPILSSASVVLAKGPVADNAPDFKFDEALEIDNWDIEEFNGNSLNFSFDQTGQQTAVTPTMQAGQITLDTFKRQQALYLDVNSTLDSQTHGQVTSYHIELKDGSPCPEWIQKNRKGFFCIEMPSSSAAIELKISAIMQHGNELYCLVKIDRESGIIEPMPISETSAGVYQRDVSGVDFSSRFAST